MNPLTAQIDKLEALKRLEADPTFQEHFQKPIEAMESSAHAELLAPEVKGASLEAARSKYAATREIARLLSQKRAALEASIRRQQEQGR